MAQYSTGTVSITAGNTTVIGVGTSWLTAVVVGDLLRVNSDSAYYVIGSVDSNTQLTLSTPYPTSKTDVDYEIIRDFSPNRDYPLPRQGDLHLADLVRRALLMIDADAQFGLTFAGSVVDKDLSAAPGITGLTDGDTYIVGPSIPTGDAWFGYENYLATWDDSVTGGQWLFTAPSDGWMVLVIDEDYLYIYDGTGWERAILGDIMVGGSEWSLALPDHGYSGTTIQDTVDDPVSFGEVLFLSSTGWRLADADATSTMPGIALAVEANSSGSTPRLLLKGIVRDDSWAFTKGDRLYVDTTSGQITATAPSGSGDIVQTIGFALSATKVLFDPDATQTVVP